MYRLGFGTRNAKDAEVFEDFKALAKQANMNHFEFLGYLVKTYKDSLKTPIINESLSQPELTRIAIALEKLVEKAG
ncbi:hypothetical protein [Coleofasciculus sp. FACHB-SPT36]|uniref:hypothetical protein n=1 Tax=Cyanophyceae TaxID=3028117 RepID=UPI00168A9315|nr:hypothetical protein [Coleofasciculus sp. FACHB-SPT36]MBD2537517.1 hypothetical protein [Coleofasciculus sp. FACHB-SPT36]